jgi:branched-subunit amino acid aminotransferase/4-amino-4-deoxychorismate lyase
VAGRVVRGSEAALSLFDRGARDGEGLFETLRIYDGRPFLWHRHLERLVLAAAELGFPVPPAPARLAAALAELLAAESLREAAARITVTRGVAGVRPGRPGLWIEAEPIAGRLWKGTRSGAARVFVSRRPFPSGPFGRYKTTSRLAYHLARDEARAARADEALLVTPLGEVLEGSTSNVFAVLGGELVTPPLDSCVLPGITRACVLELSRTLGLAVRERPIALDELLAAREIFLTNSLQEIVPVGWLEDREIPERTLAPRLLEAYREAVARSRESLTRALDPHA